MELSLSEFVATVLWACICVVVLFSLVSRFLHMREERRLAGMRVVCRICGNAFVSHQSGQLAECPACGRPNLRAHNGKLG